VRLIATLLFMAHCFPTGRNPLNILMKKDLLFAALLSVGLFTGTLQPSKAEGKEKDKAALEAKAKITEAEATKIALGKVPKGKVKEAELEQENGKLIWSFDIKTKGSKDITEVHVDAITGEVLATEKETPAAEKKEKKEKKKEKQKEAK
jgi:hypothetical protein